MKTKVTKNKPPVKVKKKQPAKKSDVAKRIEALEDQIAALNMRLDLAEAAIQVLRGNNKWPQWPSASPSWEWPIYYGIRSCGG